MALKTNTELLEEVETAISNAMSSQEYRTALGSGKKLPDLETLWAMRKELKDMVDAESSSNQRVFRGNFDHAYSE